MRSRWKVTKADPAQYTREATSMPIPSQTPYAEHTGNGVTTSFAYEFTVLSADDMRVKVDGVEVYTGFTVSGIGSRSGGAVVFSVAPTSLATVYLYREVSLEREIDYQENGDLLATTLDDDFDRLWMAIQERANAQSRFLRVPVGETMAELPAASLRSSKYFAFDSGGNRVLIDAPSASDASAFVLALADQSDAAKGAGMAGFNRALNYAVGTIGQRLADDVYITDFPWSAVGDDSTDNSAAIAAADAFAVSKGARLVIPAGTFRAKAITIHDVMLHGVLKSTGSVKADAIVLAGSVEARERKVFAWTATNPTNLPGTTYPFIFSTTSTWGGKVNIKWFGATGDNVTDDTPSINACATALSFTQVDGTPYATKRGPVVMYSPRGNYRIAGTAHITLGTVLEGQAAGSNPLSSWIKDDATYGATADDMIWWVADNETHTKNPSQAVFLNMCFVWRPSLDHASSTLQLDTAFMCFKAQAISVKHHGCWFLGSPQKGCVYSWGNKHEPAPGGGLQKVDTGTDADGLWVVLDVYDTFYDVIYGTIANVYDKGHGLISIHTPYIYQLWLGFARNFSTHSTNNLEMVINSARLEGVGIQTAPQVRDIWDVTSIVTGGRMRYRKCDITLNNPKIINKVMNSNSFFFSQSLEESSMVVEGGTVDSTDPNVRYFWPTFQLEYYANELTLKGVDFVGTMTPGPGVTSPFKSFISKFNGDVSNNGSTTKLRITGCDIDVGTSDYFINKQAGSYSTMGTVDVNGNVFRFTSSKLSFATTNVTSHRIKDNIWSDTADVIETS